MLGRTSNHFSKEAQPDINLAVMGEILSVILIGLGSSFLAPSEGMVSEMDSLPIPVYSLVEKSQTIQSTENYEILHSQEVKVTALHEEGLKHAQILLPYDDLTKIESFSGTVRDPV